MEDHLSEDIKSETKHENDNFFEDCNKFDISKMEEFCDETNNEVEHKTKNFVIMEDQKFNEITSGYILACEEENNKLDIIKKEEEFCEEGENQFENESLVDIKNQELLSYDNEEVEIKTDYNFERFKDNITLSQPEVSTELHKARTSLLHPQKNLLETLLNGFGVHQLSENCENDIGRPMPSEKCPSDITYQCELCSFKTKYKPNLQKHMLADKHPAAIPMFQCGAESTETKLCECDVCNLVIRGFSTYDFEGKKQIILKGRPTPALTKLTKQTKLFVRHFQTENYQKCEWLTGCNTKALLFCWPCLLFSNEKNLWKKGSSDLNNLHKFMKRHSSSITHIQSIIKEKTFGKTIIEHTWDDQLRISHEQHNQEVRRNREILKRFIDVVCFLGKHELGFRSHDQSENHELDFRSHDESENSAYVDFINLLAKYDETLQFHLANSTAFKDTSNLIQNDLISCIGEVVLRKIRSEIEETSFIAIVLDEITDVRNICQLSKVVRYVTKKGDIKERFLGFLDVSTKRTANALYNVVQSIVDELNCASKFVAQSYDGAAVKAGELGKLQAKVRQTYPNAHFIHCMAHPLNLVLQQSVSSIKECKVFFSTVSGIATFFLKSPKRTRALDSEVHKRMPKVGPTLWNYNGSLVQTVFECREPLIDFFEKILDHQEKWDHETVVCSRGYLDILETDTNFNLLLLVFSEIFPFCDNVFEVLQNKSSDINVYIKKIQEFKSIVLSKREQFDRLWNKLEELKIETQPPRKKIRTDIVGDQKMYYRRLFSKIIDNISTHMDTRFKDFNNLKFLELTNFKGHTTKIPEDAFDSLKKNYSQYFNFPALRSELSVIYNTSEGINKNNVCDLWKSLNDCGLNQACRDILKLCELTLTIPATTASTERNFSASNRIKNFIRNSAGQGRSTNLALLSIEKELIQEMSLEQKFYDDIIDEFAKRSRRIPLNFK